MLRNQWDLGIYLNMALVKVEQGHFETAILILQIDTFFHLFFCLGNIAQENVFYDILQRKNAFLAYKSKKFKKSENWQKG